MGKLIYGRVTRMVGTIAITGSNLWNVGIYYRSGLNQLSYYC